MINYDVFNIKLENGKTGDNLYHYMIEATTEDGFYNSVINMTMTAEEIVNLYNSIKDTHEIDLEFTESYPRFKLLEI